MIMEPQAGDPNEVEGVLNPAAIRARDGQLYLFPRLVARGNYSRIGIARVLFDSAGDPKGVERMGIALEPEADYELSGNGGGCEDPRISYVEPLQHYVMTYTAFSRRGPRIAIAISDDLLHWRRIGLATFHPYRGIAFDGVDDKDASVFPVLIPGPFGQPAIALVHRPLFPGTRPEEKVRQSASRSTDRSSGMYLDLVLPRERERRGASPLRVRRTSSLGLPRRGLGAPQNRWRRAAHHVSPWLADALSRRTRDSSTEPSQAASCAIRPARWCYRRSIRTGLSIARRSRCLFPRARWRCHGTVDNVVFPTGIDRRDDLGAPDRFDIYYGMADDRIGVARLDVPATLPRDIIDGAKQVNIFGENIPVRARIYTINGFSAHADQAELLAWQKQTGAKRTFLVHGEEDTMQQFAAQACRHSRRNAGAASSF